MAAENNVRDFQVLDGVFDNGGDGYVGRGDDVGNVAVNEDVAGLEAKDSSFGYAGIGAADPDCPLQSLASLTIFRYLIRGEVNRMAGKGTYGY